MSVRASSWAWETSRSTGSAFLVLLALADHAGQDGGDSWPSVGRLARRCRIDERTVQRAIDTLVGLGELVVEERAGPRGTNRYRLTFATAEPLPLDDPQRGPQPVQTRQDATPGDLPPPASTTPTPGTTPPESVRTEDQEPPTPIGSADEAPLSSSNREHHGQHARCRACGTNPRGPKTESAEEREARRRRELLDEQTAEHARKMAEARAVAAPMPEALRRRRPQQEAPDCQDGAA